jgi:FtsH-binding integral membrane protein
MSSPQDASELEEQRRIRKTAFWFAVAAVLGAAVVFAFALLVVQQQYTKWEETLEKHFAAIIGLPGAAAVAFVLVIFLRQAEGPVEFEGLGFKVKGAAGQVLMWVLCFLSIAAAIKLVW